MKISKSPINLKTFRHFSCLHRINHYCVSQGQKSLIFHNSAHRHADDESNWPSKSLEFFLSLEILIKPNFFEERDTKIDTTRSECARMMTEARLQTMLFLSLLICLLYKDRVRVRLCAIQTKLKKQSWTCVMKLMTILIFRVEFSRTKDDHWKEM